MQNGSQLVGQRGRDELDPVHVELRRLQRSFYRRVASAPDLDLNDLPLVVTLQDGPADTFSLEIDYSSYPTMFEEVFEGIDRKDRDTLCIVAQLFAESLVQLDKVMDEQLGDASELMKTVVLLGSQHKLVAAVRMLGGLFDKDSAFWRKYDTYYGSYVREVVAEKANCTRSPVAQEQMESWAIGKVSMAKIITAAMAELSGNRESLPALELSQDLYAIGYQLYDDVKDWRADYDNGHLSFLLRRAFAEFGLVNTEPGKPAMSSEMFGRRLHLSNVLVETLTLAAEYLVKAQEPVADMPCPKWLSWLQVLERNIKRLRRDLIDIRATAIERAKIASARTKIGKGGARHINLQIALQEAIREAIGFLQAQQRNGYLEARHLEMRLGALSDDDASACCWGSVFPRAVALHALSDAVKAGSPVDKAAFDDDVAVLIEARLRDRKGGWSYFPKMEQLLPDCDDLGEVLHVLVALDHPRTAELCEEPIELALQSQAADGGIDTWISDVSDERSLSTRKRMHELWGDEPDVEVMANLLSGLLKFSERRFRANIERGASWIAARQHASGYWASKWYVGPYYGTWACSRLFAALDRYREGLRRAKTFCLNTSSSEGCWGNRSTANVLDTSLALMTLLHCGVEASSVAAAAHYLLESQRYGGSWAGTSFIKMDTAPREVAPMPGFQQFFYGSDTMATAFALRALIGYRASLSSHR